MAEDFSRQFAHMLQASKMRELTPIEKQKHEQAKFHALRLQVLAELKSGLWFKVSSLAEELGCEVISIKHAVSTLCYAKNGGHDIRSRNNDGLEIKLFVKGETM